MLENLFAFYTTVFIKLKFERVVYLERTKKVDHIVKMSGLRLFTSYDSKHETQHLGIV